MTAASLPPNEELRLQSLAAIGICPHTPEERFDRLVRIARRALKAKNAMVSLVAREHQHFKAQDGPRLETTTREVAFCAHTILSNELMWIEDARQDPRFTDNPLVTETPHIIFYAGAPLHAPDGQRIGALAVIDDKPRPYDAESAAILADLAASVDEELREENEARLRTELNIHKQRQQDIIEATRTATWEWNVKTGELEVNRRWAEICGYRPEDLAPISMDAWSHSLEPTDLHRSNRLIEACLRGESDFYECDVRVRHRDGHWVWVHDRGRVLETDSVGAATRLAGTRTDISERKRIDLALAAHRDFLSRVLGTAQSAILVCDPDGVVLFHNAAARALLRPALPDLSHEPGDSVWRLPMLKDAKGDAIDDEAQPIATVLKSKSGFKGQLYGLDKTPDDFIQLSVNAAPLGNRDGRAEEIVVSLYDVTELASRERQLSAEKKRFKNLVDSTQGIVWERDVESGCFSYVSGQAERLLGYPTQDWLQHGFLQRHLHPEDQGWVVEYGRREAALMRNHSFDYRMQTRDGRMLWLRDFVTVGSDSTAPSLLRGVTVDVSGEYAAQEALQATRSRLALALSICGIGTWEVDLISGEQYWDAQMRQLVGLADDSPAELEELARTSLDLAELSMTTLASMRDPESITSVERRRQVRHAMSGDLRHLRLQAGVIEGERGQIRLVGAAWDCTAEHQQASALRERQNTLQQLVETQTLNAVNARHRAEHAAATQSDFLANVSHELRTPLHAILGFLALVEEGLALPEPDLVKATKHVCRAHPAAGRLLALVDDLLDLAKLESGEKSLQKSPTPLSAVVDEVIEELSPLHQARGIGINRHYSARMPMAVGDPRRIAQVIRNVLANASRFSPDNGAIDVQIRPSGDEHSPTLQIEIQDQGPGIPEDQTEHIFDKFVQSAGLLHRKAGGTGLGLPIARQIMIAHGGSISASNRTGGGASFLIEFRELYSCVSI